MSNFKVIFSNPWLLLLLILVICFIMYTFFKVNKRFRYSRNKVISFILSLICMISCILLASGMKLSYDVKLENEIMLLVDSSDSNKENDKLKDEYVKEAIKGAPNNSKLGIIKYAYDQIYALEMTNELDNAFDIYKESEDPSGITTNLEAALDFAYSKLANPSMAKIIVLSDGIETDGSAKRAVSNLALMGVKVDLLMVNNKATRDEVMPVELIYPNEPLLLGKPINLELVIQSSYKGDIELSLYDNGVNTKNEFVGIKKGMNSILISYTFKEFGLHELAIKLDSVIDTKKDNNTLYSYAYIEDIDDVLILERDNEGEPLENLLKDDYEITRKNIKDAPKTTDELRNYDEVVLCNIANSDMPVGFDKILSDYTMEFGGSLLTIGGSRIDNLGNTIANTYNREDMEDTLYQEMLPVIAEDYTPPVAVMLAIDVSGSMTNVPPGESKTLMEQAKEAAEAALKSLDPRDYVGIVAFHETAQMILPPTAVAKRRKIEDAIDKLDVVMKGTVYSDALEMAGGAVKALSNVNKKHIILISDGEPSDTTYIEKTKANLDSGVTTSVISFATGSIISKMQEIADCGNGRSYNAINGSELLEKLRLELSMEEIREFEQVEFTPQKGSDSKVFSGVDMTNLPKLGGFYGTKLKNDAKANIIGDFGQPIYATWSYGKGKVSSFMSDLNKVWSNDFYTNPNGKIIINNIIDSLFPPSSIKHEDIELEVNLDNTLGNINIYTKLNDNEKLRLVINKVDSAGNKSLIKEEEISDFKNSITAKFELIVPGVYEINVSKLNSSGDEVSSSVRYTSFSYSEEYNPFLNDIDNTKKLEDMLKRVDGSIITLPSEGYNNLTLSLNVIYDMRYVLASIILISFLADVAVRKFKFKWPHEIIKDKKNKER